MQKQQGLPRSTKRLLAEALIVYVAFCGLSLLGRVIPPLFFLVIVCGIAFPLIWGRVRRDWMAMGFALWHLLPPFEGSPTSPLAFTSIEGILTTLGMGLLFAYIFRRTRSIVAPWLAHGLWTVALIPVGAPIVLQ